MVRLLKYFNYLSLQQTRRASNFLKFRDRGLIQDIFPHESADKIVSKFSKSQTIYAGFDPTSDSLHVGNLLVLVGLLQSQRTGHQPIALIGGATGQIGDPSGRSSERTALQVEIVERNVKSIEAQIQKIFSNHKELIYSKQPASQKSEELKDLIVVNNADWYSEYKFVDFISNYGRHFRLGQMLSRNSVQSRLEGEGISFTEFSYQVFQAYDWLHLLKTYGCRFQLGGSDQMGNIMTGHELISRCDKRSVFGLTLPIITNEEGDKFGKSAGNAVWLDSKKTPEFSFYQFFIRLSDAETEKLLKLFMFLPYHEILQLIEKHKKFPEQREAQKVLAKQLTRLIHGEEGFEKALKLSDALFSGNAQALGELQPEEVASLFSGCSYNELIMEPGMTIIKAALAVKCFLTERDASRIISAGGFYINQERVNNPQEMLSRDVHIWRNGVTLFRVGKKNYHVIRWHL